MTVINFPTPTIPRPEIAAGAAEQAVEWRSRQDVQSDIDAHIAARKAYSRAVAWQVEAEESKLPAALIEGARNETALAFHDLEFRGRCLLVTMPTDPRGLVDLLMYLEKHFSILPQEIDGRSMAFSLLRTMRLSLRKVAGYGKVR